MHAFFFLSSFSLCARVSMCIGSSCNLVMLGIVSILNIVHGSYNFRQTKFKDFSGRKTSFQGPMFIQYIDIFVPFFTPKTLNSVILYLFAYKPSDFCKKFYSVLGILFRKGGFGL